MIVGIDKFRDHFAGHEDQYVLIGGAACSLLFDDAGLSFRATKDLDVVLCVEIINAEFGAAFIEFLSAGGYQVRQRSDGQKEFYRFQKPTDENYPFMIELFSRRPGVMNLPTLSTAIRLPVENDVLSLSAILLDNDYFDALEQHRTVIDGISLLSENLLIPFKAKAYLDLSQRKEAGDNSIDGRDIKKHGRDVFRLAQLLPANRRIELPGGVYDDFMNFLSSVRTDGSIDPSTFGVHLSLEQGIALLEQVYQRRQ